MRQHELNCLWQRNAFPSARWASVCVWKEGFLRARAVDRICLWVSSAVVKPHRQKLFGLERSVSSWQSHVTVKGTEVRVGTEAETVKECCLLAYQLACLYHPKISLPRGGTVHSELGPPYQSRKIFNHSTQEPEAGRPTWPTQCSTVVRAT